MLRVGLDFIARMVDDSILMSLPLNAPTASLTRPFTSSDFATHDNDFSSTGVPYPMEPSPRLVDVGNASIVPNQINTQLAQLPEFGLVVERERAKSHDSMCG